MKLYTNLNRAKRFTKSEPGFFYPFFSKQFNNKDRWLFYYWWWYPDFGLHLEVLECFFVFNCYFPFKIVAQMWIWFEMVQFTSAWQRREKWCWHSCNDVFDGEPIFRLQRWIIYLFYWAFPNGNITIKCIENVETISKLKLET